MISYNHNRGILIKWLCFQPVHKIHDLSASAGHHVCILIARMFILAQITNISIFKMGVNSQHRKVKWLSAVSQICYFPPCKIVQFMILISPPHSIIRRYETVLLSVEQIFHFIISMSLKILFSSGKLPF